MGKIPDVRVDNLDEVTRNTPSDNEGAMCHNKKMKTKQLQKSVMKF